MRFYKDCFQVRFKAIINLNLEKTIRQASRGKGGKPLPLNGSTISFGYL